MSITLPGGMPWAGGSGGSSIMGMTVADDSIQWRPDDSDPWQVLLPLSEIAGKDGSALQIQVASGYIQTKLASATTWTNLIAVSTLVGPGNTLTLGTVSTLPAGSAATVTITGAAPSQTISFGIPVGQTGSATNGVGISSSSVSYQASTSGTATPTGAWLNDPPSVTKGQYLWSRLVLNLTNATSVSSYIVAYQGQDGTNATTTANATTLVSGLMSAADKTKLDGINAASSAAVASGVRVPGTAFTVNASRNAWVSYTFSYTLTATLTVGQNLQVIATVDGAEVGRISDAVLLGLAGAVGINRTISFFVPAGKPVLFTKSGTSAVTATIVSGQETLL